MTMEISQCKNPRCKEPLAEADATARRVRCLKCGNIFATDRRSWSPIKWGWKQYPECFGNYELTDQICASKCPVAKHCRPQSPPSDADYFQQALPIDIAQGERVCPKCGFVDSGAFCSRCGTPLTHGKEERPVPINILRTFFEGWPEYVNTLKMSLLHPKEFFSGAFSPQSKLFHFQTKTLPPIQFFLIQFVVTGLVTTILDFLFSGRFGTDNFFVEIFDFILTMAWMYVPAFFLNLFLFWNLSNWEKQRRIRFLHNGEINYENTLRGFIYSTPVEMLSIPLILVFSEMLVGSDLVDFPVFMAALFLAFAGKLISMWILLPNALWFASRIPKNIARISVGQLYALPSIISSFLRLCFLM